MADLLTTLHPINDNTTDLYPNVKRDNLPQSVKDELDAIPNKVDKEQGKGLSTNDFTNADKALVDTIPDKVDKVNGKGLSTNDYTNADKALVDTIPDKVSKEQGKGLSTNDYTNADKNAVEVAIPLRLSFLNTNILDLYRMVIRSGGMITVTDASVALTSQTFPLTVSPKALLNYVGGMCQKVGDSIITAPVATVISKGFNLLDKSTFVKGRVDNGVIDYADNTTAMTITDSGVTFTTNANYRGVASGLVPCKPNSAYCISYTQNEEVLPLIACYDANGDFISNAAKTIVTSNSVYTFATPADCRFVRVSFQKNTAGSITVSNICINISNATMNGTYKPYSAPVYYPIHRDIRALDGYGWGINADCYNYIDFERKKFVKKVARVGFVTLTISTTNVPHLFSVSGLGSVIKRPASNNEVANILTGKLNNATANAVYAKTTTNTIGFGVNGPVWIYLDDTYDTPAQVHEALDGDYLYYELATPVETDISDLLVLTFPTYDIINIFAGGYLEFENENNIGVPYSVTYQSKPNTQATVLSTAQPTISEVDSNDPTHLI